MYKLYEKIMNIRVDGKSFDDICERVPIADIFQTKKRRKRVSEAYKILEFFLPDFYLSGFKTRKTLADREFW